MTVACPVPDRRPSAGEILDTPLPDLLAELDVELYASKITDRTFFGVVIMEEGGRLTLSMPPGRSEFEHDTVARYLLAQAFRVDLPELPEPFVTSVI